MEFAPRLCRGRRGHTPLMTSPYAGSPDDRNQPARAASERAAPATESSCILTINGGSSSLKFAVFPRADLSRRLFSGRVERVGWNDARLIASGGDRLSEEVPVRAPDQSAAAALVIER